MVQAAGGVVQHTQNELNEKVVWAPVWLLTLLISATKPLSYLTTQKAANSFKEYACLNRSQCKLRGCLNFFERHGTALMKCIIAQKTGEYRCTDAHSKTKCVVGVVEAIGVSNIIIM